jgi:hypothetical protein
MVAEQVYNRIKQIVQNAMKDCGLTNSAAPEIYIKNIEVEYYPHGTGFSPNKAGELIKIEIMVVEKEY